MKKKILGLALALVMLFSSVPSLAYNVRDAYFDFASQYSGFVDDILTVADGAITEMTIIDFLGMIQQRLEYINRTETITEENLEKHLTDVVQRLGTTPRFADVMSAISLAYPDAISEARQGRIDPELVPLYEAVKSMIFDYNMLENVESYSNAPISILEIEEPNDITVSVGDSLDLPASVAARSESTVMVRLPISWSSTPSTSKAGSYTASGIIDVPDVYTLDSGLSTTVTVSVTVESGSSGNDNNNNNNNSRNPGRDTVVNNSGDNTTTTQPVVHKFTFSDVPSDTTEAGKAIYALTDLGVLNGYPDGTFKPTRNITRAEFTTMAVTALGIYDNTAQSTFSDANGWYNSYIASAVKGGLIDGYPDGTFKPENNIKRADVMLILYRILDGNKALNAAAVRPANFADDSLIPDYAKENVYAIVANGIASAGAGNKIQAEELATREQCAVMLYNVLVKLGKIK